MTRSCLICLLVTLLVLAGLAGCSTSWDDAGEETTTTGTTGVAPKIAAPATVKPSPTATAAPAPSPTSPPYPLATAGPTALNDQPAFESPLSSRFPTADAGTDTTEEVPLYTFEIVAQYPHDSRAWTQGLVLEDGVLYEGTGRKGQSTLREVDLATGQVLRGVRLPDDLFGEGITLYGGKIYQLTWREHVGIIYDSETFDVLHTFTYPTEGWGLTHDGQQLIMSDGSNILYFRDPDTLEVTRTLAVSGPQGPVAPLNELEYVEGEIYANVWLTDHIARIDPATGNVVGWIDLTGLLDRDNLAAPADVLNGIAYDDENDRLFVTGKLWPALFEIELVPRGS